MALRVGQKVRLLHAQGEGVITRLIDAQHVEVDLGDDFPVDMHVGEIIPVDQLERAYFAHSEEPAVVNERKARAMKKLGTSIMELSMAVSAEAGGRWAFHLVNPEPANVLYACYLKLKGKYRGMASGEALNGEARPLFSMTEAEAREIRGLLFQFLTFLPGAGFPHEPVSRELSWSLAALAAQPKYLTLLDREGWVFPLRQNPQAADVEVIRQSDFVRIRKQDQPAPRPEPELDLHIEALSDHGEQMLPHEILALQLETLARALSDALLQNYSSLTIIHGVGEGKLRKEVQQMLAKTAHVRFFQPADSRRYGQGATKAFFK